MHKDINIQELMSKIARLESQVDALETELVHLNHALTECGFPEGIKTLKASMEELLQEQAS
ncbi:MAG: hypothetical protein RLZZ453_1256 [Chlamydiota bacterium]|jgi:exonuclease VII small subunit